MTYRLLISVAILSTISYSCSKKCNGESKNIEGILRSLPDDCVSSTGEYIIRSASDYGYNEQDSVAFEHCQSKVNFATETVIGKFVSGYCKMRITRKVTRDQAAKKVLYELTRYECGACNTLQANNNLVVVEKIPKDWKVEFSVIEK